MWHILNDNCILYADCSDIGVAWIQLIPFSILSQKRTRISVFHVFFSFIFACVGEKGRAEMHSMCLLLAIKVVVLFQLACWSVKSGTYTKEPLELCGCGFN